MDLKLLLLINRDWTNPLADRLMAVMSSLDFWLPFLGLAALVLAIRGKFHGRAFLVTVLLILAVNDSLVANALKHAVHRMRPNQALSGVRVVDLARAKPRLLAVAKPLKITLSTVEPDAGQGRSFPSGHAFNTMTMATIAALFYPRFGWMTFLLPLIVGYSRVYVGSHWPSDVLASLILGGCLSLLFVRLAELGWRKWGARVLPRVHSRHPLLLATS